MTRLDETTARATARALGVVGGARSRSQVMSVVAPSPSAACWRARSRATASIAAPSVGRRGPGPRRRRAPDAPDARTKTVSLVLVSPSTDSWSQVRAAAGRSRPHRTSGATAASVSTTDSIVAIRGWIIPTPLAMPLTVTVTCPSAVRARQRDGRRRDLRHRIGRPQRHGGGLEAGVIGRSASGTSAASPAATLSSGSRVPMIPVDRWSVRGTVVAERVGEHRARSRPGPRRRRAPVAAFARAARRDDRLGPAEPASRRRRTSPRGAPATAGRARRRTRSA